MFKIDNFVIDRVLRAYLLDNEDNLIGYLDDLNECSIDMSSESQDVRNSQGVLVRRFYRSKTASLTATNALFNLNIAALKLGSDKTTADGTTTFTMPMSTVVKSGTTTVTLTNAKIDTVKVYGLTNSGSATVEYGKDTSAAANKFAVSSGGVVTLPTTTDEDKFFIYYTKTVTSGVKYVNSADKFPRTVKIRIECQGYDVCQQAGDPDILVIAGDSFQISPDTNLSLSGGEEQTIDFSGEFASSYCSEDRELFSIFISED